MIKSYLLEHKKVCIITLCVIAILAILIISICILNSSKPKPVAFITINSRDNLYSLSLPSTLNYTVGNDSNNLSLDLFDNFYEVFIYGNTIEKSKDIDLYDVINEDKTAYFASKNNVTEIETICEIKIDNCNGYEYSMSYLDNEYGKEFYCNIVWLQTDTHIFILNFETPIEKYTDFKDTFKTIKDSFKLIT